MAAARAAIRIDPLESARLDPFLSTGLSAEPGAASRLSERRASAGADDLQVRSAKQWAPSSLEPVLPGPPTKEEPMSQTTIISEALLPRVREGLYSAGGEYLRDG